jgi:D-alanyl-D-alanine endopeptidase (penicillin-binding protein 7)
LLILPAFSNQHTLNYVMVNLMQVPMLKHFKTTLIAGLIAAGMLSFPSLGHSRSEMPNSKKAAVKKSAFKANSLRKKASLKRRATVLRPSFGQKAGLHSTSDELSLKSSVAYVVDEDTQEVLLSKNDNAVLPIASITKLMTGVVIRESSLSMDEPITITAEDIDTEKGSRSRLRPGTTLTRGELLHLALMASENRAAHALGRTFPSGLESFVLQMNLKAQQLGMADTHYAEPTGLSSKNQSSAKDLATLVSYAAKDSTLRELSTSSGAAVEVGRQTLKYKSTNRLLSNPQWDIELQKTGYIAEAGQCLVMQAKVAGRKLVMVFLDSAGKFGRTADAERVRRWVELRHPAGSQS